MATVSIEKFFVNIPQLKSEKDWLVCKFQVMHALKAADLWGYVTETVHEASENSRRRSTVFCSALDRNMCQWSWAVRVQNKCGIHFVSSLRGRL